MREHVVSKKWAVVAVTALTALVFACAKEGPAPEGTLYLRSYQAAIPESLNRLQLRAITFGGFKSFDAQGRADIQLPEGRTQVGVVVDARTDKMVLLSYSFPEWLDRPALHRFISMNDQVKVDARSTALALSMINPLFFATTIEQKADIAEKAVQLPEFDTLVREIETALSDDPINALDYNRNPHIFQSAHSVAIGAAKAMASRHELAPRRATAIDQDAAWIEQISGLSTVFKNPKMIYYAAGVYGKGHNDKSPTDTELINSKEKVMDFSIWPPKVEVVSARETPYTLPGAGYWRVGIFKGMDTGMSIEDMWSTPPAQLAFIANTWQTVIMIISLAGDTGLVPGAGPAGSFLRSTMTFEDIYPIYQAFQTGDQMTVINAFVKFFQDHWLDIAKYIFSSVQSSGGDTAAASSLFDKVGQLTGIASGLFNVVNIEVPFFYDLITAHPKATYELENGIVKGSEIKKSGCTQIEFGNGLGDDLRQTVVSFAMLLAPLLIVLYIRRQAQRAAFHRRFFSSN